MRCSGVRCVTSTSRWTATRSGSRAMWRMRSTGRLSNSTTRTRSRGWCCRCAEIWREKTRARQAAPLPRTNDAGTDRGRLHRCCAATGDAPGGLRRRDFTVDALAVRLGESRVIDVCGGVADLDAGVVRMNAPYVFDDDALRLLRGVRIAAELGFELERGTEAMIRARRRRGAVCGGGAPARRAGAHLRARRCVPAGCACSTG